MSLSYGFCLGPESTTYDSAQFAGPLKALFGDGICEYGTGFDITLRTGFSVFIGTGFALVNGRWLKNDERMELTFPPSSGRVDRYDAIAATVNYADRNLTMKVLENVSLDAILANPSIIRNEKTYSILLYMVHIRRGSTVIADRDVMDLRDVPMVCGRIKKLQGIANKALDAYSFLNSGIDEEIARILGIVDDAMKKSDASIKELEEVIRENTGSGGIGDVVVSLKKPAPKNEWLLCDGGPIPAEYPELESVLYGRLPNIQYGDKRFNAYIYGGQPAGV